MDSLAQHNNLLFKQSRKGCIRTCLGCDAKVEINIATMENPQMDIFYANEESGCCCRTFFAPIHPFEMNFSTGAGPGGQLIARYERPLACGLGNMKCCCHQEIKAMDSSGNYLGKTKETCWYCVPGFEIFDAADEVKYTMSMPTCCGGMCVDVCAEGCCNCRIPIYIFPPGAGSGDGDQVGKIVKIWSGLGKELLGISKFEVEFPPNEDIIGKARIVGSVFLMNEVFFRNPDNGSEV